MSRVRRVGTRIVKPAPTMPTPLVLDIGQDAEMQTSPLREAVIGWSVMAAVVVVSTGCVVWTCAQQGWLGL